MVQMGVFELYQGDSSTHTMVLRRIAGQHQKVSNVCWSDHGILLSCNARASLSQRNHIYGHRAGLTQPHGLASLRFLPRLFGMVMTGCSLVIDEWEN